MNMVPEPLDDWTKTALPEQLAPRSLRIQVVLYGNPIPALRKTLESILAAARFARQGGSLSRCEVALGDSSVAPLLDPPRIEALANFMESQGVDSFSYLFFGANLGSAGGSNRLAEGAGTDVLFILNPDSYLSPRCLDHLLRALVPGVGIAEGRQLPAEHPKFYDPATLETSWASGACTMVPRDVFENLGGFDDDHFFLYCDDVDFSWRVRLNGLKAVTVPAATVFHDKRVELDGRIAATSAEAYYGLLGRLMLFRRFDRGDLAGQTIDWVNANGSHDQRAALEEYEKRLASGAVPETIAGADRVAEFVGGNYAVHRF